MVIVALALACVDADADRYRGWEDCEDHAAPIHPGASEICNGRDDDCDGEVDEGTRVGWYVDGDADGHGAGPAEDLCGWEPGYAVWGDDCDDSDPQVAPGALETCNARDDDCDGEVDEPDVVDASLWHADTDGDGYGDDATGVAACTAPAGFVATGGDCDDQSAAVYPEADESCNGWDDDCDGAADEDDALDAATWYADVDADGFGDVLAPAVACVQPAGYVADATDCDDRDPAHYPGASETCNEADDDCDGNVDEPDAWDAQSWFADVDGDGFGDPSVTVLGCEAMSGYVANAADCNDAAAAVSPGATEACDLLNIDEDCDGVADDADPSAAGAGMTPFYLDADGDTYGDPMVAVEACDVPSGYATDAADCDDTEALVNPGATEYCDDVDQDCDGDTWDVGTCSGIQNLEAIADGTWEGDTGSHGVLDWPTFVGDQDGDGTDDLVLTGAKESDVVPGDDFGGLYFVPGGQPMHAGMTKAELATITWEGDSIHDQIFSAWDAGDVNGDGNRDLWLGTDAYYGMASLLLGPSSDWGVGGSAASVADVSWYGEDYRDGFPYFNAVTAEDFDGDGFDDAALVRTNSGAPSYTQDAATFLIFGRDDIADESLRYPSDEVRIDGLEMSNVAAGDINGDGTTDLLLNGTDVIYLVDGSDLRSTTLTDVGDLALASVVPDASSGRGSSLQYHFDVVGDWTGDGVADWAASDCDRPEGTKEGLVYLIEGGVDALSAGAQIVDDVAVGSFVGDDPYPESIGNRPLIAVKDLDGDGVEEIATSWLQDEGTWDAYSLIFSSAEGLSGTQTAVPDRALRLRGGDLGEYAGYWSVSSGDFDGDGENDFALGYPYWNSSSGRSYLVLGGSIPWDDPTAW